MQDFCTGEVCALCTAKQAGAANCVHIARIAHMSPATSWKDCAQVLHRLAVDSTVCPSIASLLGVVLRRHANGIDGHIDNIGLPSNILKQDFLVGPSGKRKSRVDEDYVLHLSERAVRQKCVHSVAQLGRATSDMSESSCRFWDESFLRKYQASAWWKFEDASFVSIAEDGARVG